jgi:chromosome partitioning protein
LVDSDVQQSSSVWLHEADPQLKIFRLQTPDDILDQIPRIQSEFDHLVVDGPGGLSEVTRTILLLADVTYLPCGPSVLDLRAANEAIRVVRQVQHIRHGMPRAVLVPNKLQVQYRLSAEFLEAARSLEIPTSKGLRLLQAYADAVGQGTVVWRMSTRSAQDAGTEIRLLFTELVAYDGNTTTTNERRIANG